MKFQLDSLLLIIQSNDISPFFQISYFFVAGNDLEVNYEKNTVATKQINECGCLHSFMYSNTGQEDACGLSLEILYCIPRC